MCGYAHTSPTYVLCFWDNIHAFTTIAIFRALKQANTGVITNSAVYQEKRSAT